MKATLTLIALNVICYFLALHIEYASIIFSLNNLFLKDGFYWQPISSMFMHGDLTHLCMNMVVLYQCGFLIEKSKGWKFFTFLYMIGGILTSLFTYLFLTIFELHHYVVGASGAISVLFGYIACKSKELRYGLIVVVIVISFVPEFFGMNIAWYAHFIGFILGYLFGMLKYR